jgi:hypothetical protein
MVHCNKDLAKGNDCSSYYIYKALKEKLDKFIADINNMKKIESAIDLGDVNFHNSTFDHINFILGKAKLNLDTGEISTVLNPHNPQNIRLDFIKKLMKKLIQSQLYAMNQKTAGVGMNMISMITKHCLNKISCINLMHLPRYLKKSCPISKIEQTIYYTFSHLKRPNIITKN